MNLEKISQDMKQKYEKSYTNLINILKIYSPIDLIEYLTLQNIMNGQLDGNNTFSKTSTLELIYGIMLSIDFKSNKSEINIKDIEEIIKLAETLQFTYTGSRMFINNSNHNEIGLDLINQSTFVRGDATPYHIKKQLNGLFKNHSDILIKLYGFNIDDALNFINELHKYYEESINKFIQKLKNEAERKIVQEYNRIKESKHRSREERKFKIKFEKNKDELIFDEFIELCNSDFKGVTRFNIDIFEERLKYTDIQKFKKFLDYFSIDVGRSIQKFDYPNDKNIYTKKPILKFESEYIIPDFAILIQNMQSNLERELKNSKKWENYQKGKGNYLEREAIDTFKRMLNNCTCYDSLKYDLNESGEIKECELDGLILYDNNILLIEAKSGIFHEKARKGYIKKLETNIKDNIESAYLQADRARRYLKSSDVPQFKLKSREIISLDMKLYDHIYLINVTLENFSSISTMMHKLNQFGLYKSNEFPWSVNLNDLKIISDFIQFPAQFLHYLKKRVELANKDFLKNPEVFTTDELDLLGDYLEGNLYYEDYREYSSIMIEDYNPYFNKYYNSIELGISIDKIGQRFDDGFIKLIYNLEKDKEHGYSEVVTKLLDLSSEHREQLIEYINIVTKKTTNDGLEHNATLLFQLSNPNNTKSGFGVSIMSSLISERDITIKKLKNYCELKKYQQKSYEWIGIATYIDKNKCIKNEILFFRHEESINEELEEGANKFLKGKMIKTRKIGRNEPCPCGSGKKYKKCHGK
ncbi:YecA family protein [Paraclostridium sordellii]|uniref:YecA family protein n=1 Tax=Paraclostridium sordellii TaxID=1505 RepID=UPI0005E84976|nr:SEC-C domain-containing protein [Paeniclostridium sordellii]CEQ14600.1 SEC-C motif domain protein [[Clostridium] sordellii] [Paeniclostridium sordellii]